ncbi:DUF3866 family protein [Paenibacillus sp. H1-7]|uniref:DUF3866 family protein n=1 Tax=Paenibacillus sp. H1-7 TaxID=2282849 RepID=UPI001EF77EA9|nr:DUF3866 family protein [Paenibacillus sp. H1-7]ULL15481.1 DUF3866 family protein [Paenibacillus sp. H1-7]
MIEWKIATVVQILSSCREQELEEVQVRFTDGSEGVAIHYGNPVLLLEPGDRVLLNTTAVSLGLGTGGVHFVHDVLGHDGYGDTDDWDRRYREDAELKRMERTDKPAGHIMKLRYTSLQRTVMAVEEQASPFHELFTGKLSLEGMPVLVGELHSMLPVAASRLQQLKNRHPEGRQPRIAYIMSDSAALPLAFSKHVKQLKKLGWLAGTITYGQAYGGDHEAVNKFTALLAARHVLSADLAIAAPGPGSVGTGTLLGFSGTEAAELIHAVSALKGRPVVIPRISFAEQRSRHQGISHHTMTVLQDLTLVKASVPLPELEGEKGEILRHQMNGAQLGVKHDISWHEPVMEPLWREAFSEYPTAISSMGRGLNADPAFFAAIGAAVDCAWMYATHKWHLRRA